MNLIGRNEEKIILEDFFKSDRPEFLAMISANRIKDTIYSDELVQGLVTLEDLFN